MHASIRRLIVIAAIALAGVTAAHSSDITRLAGVSGPGLLAAHSSVQAGVIGPGPLYCSATDASVGVG